DPLPPLWHWCAFPLSTPNDKLGKDGHPRETDLLPPVRLDRRMWAGGALKFYGPALKIGDPLERRSSIRSVTEKDGSSGPMVFVTVDHAIYGPAGLAIEERQDIVYLEIPKTYTPPSKKPLPVQAVEQIDTTEALLFRYSAVTFNAHRIHYDLPYTREVEKYPGLVVHGPLQATLLMRAAIRERGRTPKYFDFRGVHPMFAGAPCEIAFAAEDAVLSLWTGQDGHQCMQATAIWADA
ncbi:MAG: MaoC family dehydratase N-terminal domain-containing protein, partial [Marivita lacus]|nr:MaoC family dehydratase N-terminal domain-containing protein [Marivita lacus]